MKWIARLKKNAGNAAMEESVGNSGKKFRPKTNIKFEENSAPILAPTLIHSLEVAFSTECAKSDNTNASLRHSSHA